MRSNPLRISILKDCYADWEKFTNIFSGLLGQRILLILKQNEDDFEVVLIHSKDEQSIKNGDLIGIKQVPYFYKTLVSGTEYCEYNSNNWDFASLKNLKYFLASKLCWNNGNIFGLICLISKKVIPFSSEDKEVLNEFKKLIERDLKILEQNEIINNEINERKKLDQELRAANEELKAGLEKKHTEIYQINQDLKKIQEDYKLIVENQNALVVKFDKDFRLTYISPQYAKELGTTSEQIIGESFYPFIHSDDLGVVKKSHENLKKAPYECSHEERMKTVKGWRWYYWANKSIVNPQGEIEGIVAVGRDVTEKKEIEQALKESEERYKLAMKGANDGLWDIDLINNTTYLSRRWKSMLGYQEHELENMNETWEKLVHPKDLPAALNTKKNYLNGKLPKYQIEFRMLHKNGSWINILSRGYKVMDSQKNKPIRFVGTHVDITELRNTEAALRKSEYQFRKIIELNSIPILVTDLDDNVKLINRAFTNTFGYKIEEIPTVEVCWEKAFPETRYRNLLKKKWVPAIEEAIKKGTEIEKQVWNILCKDGSRKIVEFSFVGLGEMNVITMLDLTERIQAEKDLKESEEKNRALSEATDEGLIFTYRGVCIECNKAALRMLGYGYAQMIGMQMYNLVIEEHKAFVLKNMMMGNEEPFEAIVLKNDGQAVWVELRSKSYNYKGKEIKVTSFKDITKRKEAESALIFSEEKFRAAFKTSPDSVNINRYSDGLYIEINEGFTSLTGYTEKDIEGKSIDELHIWVNKKDKEKFFDKLKIDGRCVNLEAPFRMKNGKIVTTLTSASLISLNSELYVISITRNIQELKDAENELIKAKKLAERKEKEYKDLFSEMLDGFALHEVIYDKKGEPVDYKYIEINPAYEKLTGLKYDEIKDKTVTEVLPNIEKQSIRNFGNVGKTGEPYWFEDFFEDLDKYYNGLAYCPQKDYFAVIFRDVSDQKRAEKILLENDRILKEQNEEYQVLNEELTALNLELIEAKNKAEESDKLKTAFLANMSHEIRTPMNGIMGFSGLLAKESLNREKRLKYIDVIKQNSSQLLTIINDLVDISKIEAGQVEIVKEEVRLDFLTMSLADLYYQRAIDKNIDFQLINQSSNIEIITDETKLRQVLINLLDNAFKFTQKGKINFGYSLKDNYIEFFVSDTGIGIEEENLGIIFERFRQVELTSARKFGGTGLGLSISKAYIEKMGGKIWVDSKINVGSKFMFTLPLELVKKTIKNIEEKMEDIDNINWSSKTILIAEDEEINYRFFEEILIDTNVNLIWAVNGQEAIEQCMVNDSIDLILMDIKMPVLNGYDATREIKKMKPALPIIAQTAYALVGDEMKAREAGCDDYIHKPIDIDDMIRKIARFLDK